MSHGLSKDEIDDLKEAFNMFDVDGGGKSLWLLRRAVFRAFLFVIFISFVRRQHEHSDG